LDLIAMKADDKILSMVRLDGMNSMSRVEACHRNASLLYCLHHGFGDPLAIGGAPNDQSSQDTPAVKPRGIL